MRVRTYKLVEFDACGRRFVEHFPAPSDAVALGRACEVAAEGRFQLWREEHILIDAAAQEGAQAHH